jgi:hypothetical protein
MKIKNAIPSRPHHLVVTFDDGRRTRLDISQWLERNASIGPMFTQGEFGADSVEWPLGERLTVTAIQQMLDQQCAVIS